MWRSHLSYHPRLGYTYLPNYKGRHSHESGGYLIRANAAGFRSDREFTPAKPPGVYRVLLFGDSQTAGLGVNNGHRFGDLLEKAVPGLEVFNYGVDGAGVDQQHLAWQDYGQVEHDLLVIALYVHDAERVNSRFQVFRDQNGEEAYFAKPYYVRTAQGLELQGVPVPKQPWTKATLPEEARAQAPRNGLQAARSALRKVLPSPALRRALKDLGLTDLAKTTLRQAPEYAAADAPAWLLLRDILAAWIAQSPTPVLLLPLPSEGLLAQPTAAAAYQARFRELAAQSGARLHDPIPELMDYPEDTRQGFRFKGDGHLTAAGHQAIARSLVPAVEALMTETSRAPSFA